MKKIKIQSGGQSKPGVLLCRHKEPAVCRLCQPKKRSIIFVWFTANFAPAVRLCLLVPARIQLALRTDSNSQKRGSKAGAATKHIPRIALRRRRGNKEDANKCAFALVVLERYLVSTCWDFRHKREEGREHLRTNALNRW